MNIFKFLTNICLNSRLIFVFFHTETVILVNNSEKKDTQNIENEYEVYLSPREKKNDVGKRVLKHMNCYFYKKSQNKRVFFLNRGIILIHFK